jgi:Transglutaminase-like superfamily
VTEYYIPNHVHFVLDGDAAVFLDLRTDQYSMLLGSKAHAFDRLLVRTSDSIGRVIGIDNQRYSPTKDSLLSSMVVTELLEQGLLTAEAPEVTAPLPANIPLPDTTLIDSPHADARNATIIDIVRFLVSCTVATVRLRCVSIESVVRKVDRRNRLRTTESCDLAMARRLVGIYKRLKPLLPLRFSCLYDSLSLLEFLAKYACYPNWVFAVQLEPWAAHCWVQFGTVAFNEEPDLARTYLPVMKV